jgi:uncharacterized repeat protein (TIGR03803 family)
MKRHKPAASGNGAVTLLAYFERRGRAASDPAPWLSATLVLWLLGPSFAAAVTFTNLHSFQLAPLGAQPLAPLALGSDGNLYGTTSAGGPNNGQGTVFKMNTNGLATLLYTFSGGADQGLPESALTLGADGCFYGTTSGGGANSLGFGTVFKITTNGVLTTLVQFSGGNDGSTPVGGLVLGPDGSFYGATEGGGAYGFGTVFRLAPNGQFTNLFSFDFTNNGDIPVGPLALGRDGRLYGTTTSGGVYNAGTVFQIATNGALATLRSLGASPSDPQSVEAPLVQGADGSFYGTAYGGGDNRLGCVFRITTSGALTNLYSFGTITNSDGNPLDGAHPFGGLVFGSDGNLYGTTESGGTNALSSGGDGTIFRITPAGALTTLYSFYNGVDGAAPDAGLLVIGATLYGTASQGGVAPGLDGNGTVFKIGMNGAFAFVYDFPGLDGLNPSAGLALDQAGNLYGTTEAGGFFGGGTVFKYQPHGAYTVLTNFDFTNGSGPDGQLLRLPDGTLLGTALNGGAHSGGTIFRVTTNGILTTVYDFGSVTNASGPPLDGAHPWSGLTLASDGNYYGTTERGGTQNFGVVFGLTPNGTLTNVVPFDGVNSGYPQGALQFAGANLVLAPDGDLYGTTPVGRIGSIFTFAPGGGVDTVYGFSAGTNGYLPIGGLALGLDGCLYGTTAYGGAYGYGIIFKITTDGLFTNLYSFDGTNGAQPAATLLLVGDTFYGTTMVGGSASNGVIFRFETNGAYTNLYSFQGLADGANPDGGLTLGLDGNLYGVAEYGGADNNGTLFELRLSDPAPVLLSVEPTNNAAALSWSAVAGRKYQLQFTGDPSQHSWSNLGLPMTATDSTVVATDPSPRTARRFYRVLMLP